MTGWNLPPGCTDRMVDEAFGYSSGRRGTYTVTVTRTVYERVELEVEASSAEDAHMDAILMASKPETKWSQSDDPDYDIEACEGPPERDPDDERDARADYEYDRDR